MNVQVLGCSHHDTPLVVRERLAFNPDQTPWHPPQEKNIEEVFKHHQYFAIVYSAAGKQLAVSRCMAGSSIQEICYAQPSEHPLCLDRCLLWP